MSKAELACKNLKEHITDGFMISVDPSSAGGQNYRHSCPYFSVWAEGRLVDVFGADVPGKLEAYERLRMISEAISHPEAPRPDVVIIEDVGVIRGKFPKVSKPLIWSVGAILAALKPKYGVVEVMPTTWKKYTDKSNYVKSDRNDSIAIGWAAINMANGTKDILNIEELLNDKDQQN